MTQTTTNPEHVEPQRSVLRHSLGFIRHHIREYGILFALIAIMAFFQIATGGILLKPVNLTNLILQNSYIIIMAIGMLLVIVAGHIDLSVGSVLGFVGALAAVMIVHWGVNYWIAGIICLGVGAIIGMLQGFWIAYYKIPSFIVTLAGMLVFKGLTLWLLAGQSVGPFPAKFQLIASGFIPDPLGGDGMNLFSFVLGVAVAAILLLMAVRTRRHQARSGVADEPFAFFAIKNALIFTALVYMSWLMADFRGLPNVFIVMALLIAVYSFIASRTTVGRRIYAIGGNEKAARLSGSANPSASTCSTIIPLGNTTLGTCPVSSHGSRGSRMLKAPRASTREGSARSSSATPAW